MGTSTNAILFYGYCWDEEASTPWELETKQADEDADEAEAEDGDDEENADADEDEGADAEDGDDWETLYARTQGCLPPSTPFPARTVTPTRENGWNSTPTDYSADEQAIIAQYHAYWDQKHKICEASPCIVATHCSVDCPMPYVAVQASHTVSYRGDPKEITALAVDPAWAKALEDFCAALGIKTDGKKAGWWLVSDWT